MMHIPAWVWVPSRNTAYETFKGSGVLSGEGDPLMTLQDAFRGTRTDYKVFWSIADLDAYLVGTGIDAAQVQRVKV